VLGLEPGSAGVAQVRRAYLELAARWHPDKWGAAEPAERADAETRFKEVQAAYELLAGG
jgi:DnaJ-class molecular chaperone